MLRVGIARVTRVAVVGVVLFGLMACQPSFPGDGALVATSGESTNVRLIWNPAFDLDRGDSIAYYVVEVDGVPLNPVPAPQTQCTVVGLRAHSQYTFSVTAYSNHKGGMEWSGDGGRLSTTFDTPNVRWVPTDLACGSERDTDGDRLPDWAETDTGVYVNAGDSGTSPDVADTDGDAINDGDEVLGTLAGLNLPELGFSPLKKDLALEFDWFDDNAEPAICGAHSHRPTTAMITALSAAYADAPVANPDGSTGIHLVADTGQAGGGNVVKDPDGGVVVTVDTFGLAGSEFVGIKAANFKPNRSGYFHYVLVAHSGTLSGKSFGGVAELPGDDSIVSPGCYGSTSNVSAATMHEVGHNLSLRHGGDTDVNYKPNYNSIMNYRYIYEGIDSNCDAQGDGVLDYSHGTRAPLDELFLYETLGVCDGAGPPIDWDGSGSINSLFFVVANLNSEYDFEFTTLTDNNDWAQISFGGVTDTDGAPASPPQVIVEEPVPVSAR